MPEFEPEISKDELKSKKESQSIPEQKISPEDEKNIYIQAIFGIQDQLIKKNKEIENKANQATVKILDARGFYQRFHNPFFIAVYVPTEKTAYTIEVPKKYQFKQAYSIVHELNHASYEIAKEESHEDESVFDQKEYANLREAFSAYLVKRSFQDASLENPIIKKKIEDEQKLKRGLNKSDKEILKNVTNNKEYRQRFQRVGEAVMEYLGGDAESKLISGWFSGNLKELENYIREEFDDEFISRLGSINFNNQKEIVRMIREKDQLRKDKLIEFCQSNELDIEIEDMTYEDMLAQTCGLLEQLEITDDPEKFLINEGILEES